MAKVSKQRKAKGLTQVPFLEWSKLPEKELPIYDEKKHRGNPLEKVIEKKVCDYAKKMGCKVYKFSSPSYASVPDRIIITPRGVVGWLEMKRKGKKPTPKQQHELDSLSERGCNASWADSFEGGKKFVDMLLKIEEAETIRDLSHESDDLF